MTAVREPVTDASAADQLDTDAQRAPVPTANIIRDGGPTAIHFRSRADYEAWADFGLIAVDPNPWGITVGRTEVHVPVTFGYPIGWRAVAVYPTQDRPCRNCGFRYDDTCQEHEPEPLCSHCGGAVAQCQECSEDEKPHWAHSNGWHQCEDRTTWAEPVAIPAQTPIPYVPVPMPTGAQANAAECARLNSNRCPSCESPAPSLHPSTAPEGGEVIALCRDPFHGDAYQPVTPELTDRSQRSISFVTHAGHQRRDLPESLHVIPEGVLPRRKTPAEVELHEVPIVEVVTVDPDLTAGNDAVIAPLLPPQTSFGEAAERLRVVREADEFAEIVAEVRS